MVVQFTTDLPDADQPALGNGVEDEVQVDRETQVTDNGEVRFQIRETGQSVWGPSAVGFAEGTVPFDQLTFAVTGREDGEEYEVRLRTETDDVTGTFTTPVAITTKFPGADNLSVTGTGVGTVSLSWVDQADNEDGYRVQRERKFEGSFGPVRTVTTLSPNTTTHTEATASPDRTYRYRIEAFTEDAQATSNTVTATTAGAGTRQTAVPSEGWYLDIEVDR